MAELLTSGTNGSATVTVEDKFEAALSVIKSLPKNGSYKPSPEMMLKFYSYYKQATEGPCTKAKPWAWDVINKVKWDAWSKLGDMPRVAAMEKYVESLMKIVEAMPLTDDVESFIKTLGDFYEVVELEPPEQYKKFYGKTLTAKMNGNGIGHLGVNGDRHSESEDSSAGIANEYDSPAGRSRPSAQSSPLPVKLNGDSEHVQQGGNEEDHSSFENKFEFEGDQDIPSDSEDEFCDTAENVQVNGSNQHSSREFVDNSRDSLSNEYTIVNNDDHLVSSSSANDDSLSTLDETFEENSHEGNQLSSNNASQQGKSTVKVRTRGGEHGTRGTDNQTSSSTQEQGTNPHRGGRPSREQEMQGRGPQRFGQGMGGSGGDRRPGYSYSEVQDQIATTLIQLQQDMNSVLNRLTILEALTVGQQARRGRTISGASNSSTSSRRHHKDVTPSSWWPFSELSPKTALFIILWPFAVRWILQIARRRHSRR